ncbi:MAG TPA: hypothetical protein VGL10_05630 [Gammaproteobacteria bacterium]
MQRHKFRIPPRYLLLDTLGSILVGLGVYGLVMSEEPSGLAFLHLKRDAWQFIVGGLMLMAPMVVYVIKQLGASRFNDSDL